MKNLYTIYYYIIIYFLFHYNNFGIDFAINEDVNQLKQTNIMTFIKATSTTKVTIFKGWKITKVNNGVIFVKTDNPFKTNYENGYISVIDIFGRHILVNSKQCIDMVETEITEIVNDYNITQYYEGTPEVRTNYTSSDNFATPISENEINKICG